MEKEPPMSIDDVRIEVLGRNVVSSADWQQALKMPAEKLPRLNGKRSPASQALGLTEEEDQRRILAQSIAHERIREEGRRLLEKLAPTFQAVPDFHVVYLRRDLTKAVWVITPDVAWVPAVALSDEEIEKILSVTGAGVIEAVQNKLTESVASSRQLA
jgi:hypothetical protein